MPRIYTSQPLSTGMALTLEAGPSKHIQVLRMQPAQSVTLFNGAGGEYEASITRMGRSDVDVTVGAFNAIERELAQRIHLYVGLFANERMDWLIEKATELGAASITPVQAQRSSMSFAPERAAKKLQHWQAAAISACEQCARNRLPRISPVVTLNQALAQTASLGGAALLLAFTEDAVRLSALDAQNTSDLHLYSGPEGGYSPQEESRILAAGHRPITLGSRILRAETAPLAALSYLALRA